METSKKIKLIGLYGRARTGKDSVAHYLGSLNFKRVSFADKLKQVCSELSGLHLKYFYDDDLKDHKLDFFLHGVQISCTPRDFIIAYGTGFVREIDSEFWLKCALNGQEGETIVISDVRFPNEAQAIKDAGGTLIHLIRTNFETPSDNPLSEGLLDDFDGFDHVVKAETLKDLFKQIDNIL